MLLTTELSKVPALIVPASSIPPLKVRPPSEAMAMASGSLTEPIFPAFGIIIFDVNFAVPLPFPEIFKSMLVSSPVAERVGPFPVAALATVISFTADPVAVTLISSLLLESLMPVVIFGEVVASLPVPLPETFRSMLVSPPLIVTGKQDQQ